MIAYQFYASTKIELVKKVFIQQLKLAEREM